MRDRPQASADDPQGLEYGRDLLHAQCGAKLEKISTRASNSNTFGSVADELLGKLEREGRRDATLTKLRWLLGLARFSLGTRPIADILPDANRSRRTS